MVTLDIKDKQLYTDDDFTVSIEDKNPATEFKEIPGSKAIGISLPASNDTNRISLGNPERFEKMGSIDDRRFEGAVLRHFGQVIHSGTLIIEEARKNYSGWLRDVVGNLNELVTNKPIHKNTLGGQKTFVKKATYNPLTDDYDCPQLFNRHFWRDRGRRSERTVIGYDLEGNEFSTEEEDNELSWQFFENQQFLVNKQTGTGVVTTGTDIAPVVSPMLFLWKLVEKILADNYIFVKQNFLKDDTELQKLILYNNFNILKQLNYTETKTIYTRIYHTDSGYEEQKQVINKTDWSVGNFFYKDLVPNVSLGKFILGLQNYLNVVFSFNDLNECRIVDRQKLLTLPAFDIDEYMVGEWEPGTRKNVCVKLSMSHDSQDYAFGDNWEDLSDIRQNIKEPVAQRADLDALTPDFDEIRKVIAENNYYQYHWYVATTINSEGEEEDADVLDWEKITIAFQPYFYNDGDREVEEVETCFSTIQQSGNGYPLIMQRGNSEAFKTQPEAFTPRLLFSLGNGFASYRTSNLSLDFDGDDGLAKKRWNYWLPFWANRLPAIGIFKFPASVFYYLKNNKAILPLKTRHGSFIIDEIKAIAGNADTVETELTVYKRESVVSYQTGTTPGTGEIVEPVFTADYVGVTDTGKPYLVNSDGDIRIAPAWGTLSTTEFAKTNCVDYDAVTKQLFVGGINGMLHITDFSDQDNITMKSIKIFDGANVSAVRFLNDLIFIGKDLSNKVYVQLVKNTLAEYTSYQAGEATLSNGYVAKDFVRFDGYYYCCTKAGEIHRTNAPVGNWTEVMDVKADFRRMVTTTDKIFVFGKDDNDNVERSFYALLSNPTNFIEFDVVTYDNLFVTEAADYGSNRVLVTLNTVFGPLRIIESDLSVTFSTPSPVKTCGGLFTKADGTVGLAFSGYNGAANLAIIEPGWTWINYISVPQLFTKLFAY